MIMVQLTEELEKIEVQDENRDDVVFSSRRQYTPRRHSRVMKAKKGNWKRGIQQRRNKRFAW